MNTTLKEGVDWVGYVDWTVRDFHGYFTNRGSSYNSYLIRDEKVALIDAVKAPYAQVLLDHVSALVPLEKVDYLVINHAEPDHAGSIPAVIQACPGIEIVCDARCRDALDAHFDTTGWTFKIVGSGDSLSLGKRSLSFLETPMVHWPESMFTYCPEEKILFSMDAFGQHYASAHRFDDEEPMDVVMEEAKTYYANIVMLYAKPIARVLGQASELDIDLIAPSHGVIWRSHIDRIKDAYAKWVSHHKEPKVLVIYDTMWQSTEKMAQALVDGALSVPGVNVRLFNVRSSNVTILATEVLDAATVAVGSPTLNQTLMPAMAAVLTYWKGLKPAEKAGFAFGSYGWAQGAARDIEQYLKDIKFDLIREPLQVRFVPKKETLDECREAGKLLAEKALELSS
ncbi:MAG: FprA family A-type flavoprotein [Kiritimatiellae bacterium]|nr:FprA family A-type flavoprotein [Kiritimatiellia bacterium]